MNWKRLFKLEQHDVLGLDIGSSSVKLIQLRKDNGSYIVTAAGIVEIAAGKDDKNLREIKTVETIRDCLEATETQTRWAVCGISGPEVAVRYFKFPSLPLTEIEGAILLEAEQVCPFNINDGTVDYQLIPNGDDSICGVLVAATNKLIEQKREMAENASLNCVLMDVEGLALLNCFKGFSKETDSINSAKRRPKKSHKEAADESEEPKAGQTTAILNIGSSYATLAIMGDNALPFIRDMSYAGDNIVEQIANEHNVSTGAIKQILLGHENPTEPHLEITNSLERACQKLIVDVTNTLRYHTAQEKSADVEKILVCGGFAMVKGLIELLNERLAVKAVLWNPLEKIRCEAGQSCEDMLQKNGPALAVAAGLAMRVI